MYMKLEMGHESSGGGSPLGSRRGEGVPPASTATPSAPSPAAANPEHAFQHQILQHFPFSQLKKQQQLQQQILLQHFQAQQQQLAEQHEAQIRQHVKLWEQQRALEEQQQQQQQQQQAAREQRERERLDALRKKDKHDHSAVASTEVKQKLQVFLMKKQAAASANGTVPGSPYRNWGVVKSSSGESITSGVSNSHPYRLPQQQPVITKYDSSDFPLRKTASEPNLLKVRLKQRVIERRASPMARRQDRLLKHRSPSKLAHHHSVALRTAANCGTSGSSNPDSGPNSPPIGAPAGSRGSPTAAAPIREEVEEAYGQQGSIGDLSLFSSPSMPNISLGRPHVTSTTESNMLATVSEAEVRAAFTARLGVPLTEGMLPPSLPYYPMLPVESYNKPPPHQPITDIQVAHARLNKRPLGRTQSAPLPLGHPMLVGTANPSDMSQHHYYLKQQIRQTVLTRAGARETGQLDEREETAEVIDLTDKKAKASNEENEPTFMQQQRMMRHSIQNSDEATLRGRPLCRALSSPLVHLGPPPPPQAPSSPTSPMETGVNLTISRVPREHGSAPTTGLAYDNLMLKHACVCGDNSAHPEHGGRLQSVWARLQETGLVTRCDRVRSRKASLEELQTCHQEAHTLLFGTNPLNRQKLDMSKLATLPIKNFVRLACGGIGIDSDTTWNELHTAPAARMAAGCVIDLAFKTYMGDIKNGFAVVRPPGHHAEASQAMGFCFFNSIAVAARLLQQRLDVKRILIVDWDVHHGNGTQQIFYDDPHVLYLSIHRHDDGNFFPGTGGPTECGSGLGVGYNVNVAWSGGLSPPLGDAEYLAAFRTIVMPIAKEFDPSIVLVSCGFDAAIGHPPPLGGYKVSPACFGYMTKELLQVANGKVVLALEGGYDLPAICDCAQECVRALLGDEPSPISPEELVRPPAQCAIETLQKTIAIQLSHWPCIKRSTSGLGPSINCIGQSERDAAETVSAMASLSMHQHHATLTPETNHDEVEEPMDQDDAK
ncbi:histone deacetylase 4 isoform X3 [Arctopsyche grandis]|uniref:histone deacetylase 4 isoform X3 n=1 Tax=Arctopsyche grandis TaxID=121162 RepID=UPI00406D93F7